MGNVHPWLDSCHFGRLATRVLCGSSVFLVRPRIVGEISASGNCSWRCCWYSDNGVLTDQFSTGSQQKRSHMEGENVFRPPHSAVVGSIIVLTSETRFAGNPPWAACSRTMASFGAR